MTASESNPTICTVLDIHAMIHGFIGAAVADVPAARMTEQPAGVVNHPAWTLSHLNAYAGMLLTMLGDDAVPTADAEMAQYGSGTVPVSDPATYATKDELVRRFDDRTARVAAVVAERHAAWFPKPAPERFRPHAPTIGHVALTLLIAHPPDHLGQLRRWRRASGLEPTM